VQDRQLALVVDDGDAIYPVTIDPLITRLEATLTGRRGVGDGARGDDFGYSVSLSGDGKTALVGVPYKDMPAGSGGTLRDQGSVYVFVRSGTNWNEQAQLTASDGAFQDYFGISVSLSMDGSTAMVGAICADNGWADEGSAYVFVRSGSSWIQQAKLTAGDRVEFDHFGRSVSLSNDGNAALVGAPGQDIWAGSDAGSGYVFVRSGSSWIQQAILTAGDRRPWDSFGSSVSLSNDGNAALVGAPGHDTPASSDAGSGYVFVRGGTNWTEQAQLTASDGAAGDKFGGSVSLNADGSTAIVGASCADNDGWDDGSAYVFVRNGSSWIQQAKLTASDGEVGDEFGCAVSLSVDGSTALVGAEFAVRPAGADSAGSAYLFVRSGSDWSQQGKLTPDRGRLGDNFGSSVSLSRDGTTALVGTPLGDAPAVLHTGSASVFVRNGNAWTEQEKLLAGALVSDKGFGASVSLSRDGNTALLGAQEAGSAHVFVRSMFSWAGQARLTASDGQPGDGFGCAASLSADGNTALVGARSGDSLSGTNAGSVYLFARSGNYWNQQSRLTASNGQSGDEFGQSVSLSGDGNTALVGAYGDDTSAGTNAGSAYVFVRSGTRWNQQAQLTPSDGAASDQFGWSLSLSADGSTAVIGANGVDLPAGADAGRAYVFVRHGSTWTQQAELASGDLAPYDWFGSSVSLSADGNTVLISATGDDTSGGLDAAGSVYQFHRDGTTWSEQAKLRPDSSLARDYFGNSVSLSADGRRTLVGAFGADTSQGTNAGSAYLFERTESGWSQQVRLQAEDGASGDAFGNAVGLSGDGGTALAGASGSLWGTGSAYVFRVSTPDGPPILSIESSGASGTISWWPVAPGFGLEATDDLVSPAWSPVPGSSPVTIPLSATPKFYRLKKP
jgi:hypothetical protein